MSRTAVEQVVGRLMLDADFRQLIAANRVQALAEYDLTDDELASLVNLDLAGLQGAGTTLDERVSKASWGEN